LRNHAVGQASRLSPSKENFRLSGWSRFPAISPIGELISSERRQARRLSYDVAIVVYEENAG
jgi:hypothetical protein